MSESASDILDTLENTLAALPELSRTGFYNAAQHYLHTLRAAQMRLPPEVRNETTAVMQQRRLDKARAAFLPYLEELLESATGEAG